MDRMEKLRREFPRLARVQSTAGGRPEVLISDEEFERGVLAVVLRRATTREIAECWETSSSWIEKERIRRGIYIGKMRKALYRQAFDRFKSGEESADLAKEIGVSRSGLLQEWARLGLHKYPLLTRKRALALWERRNRGERTRDLAAEVNRTPNALLWNWRRLGLDPRAARWKTEEKERANMYRRAVVLRQSGLSWGDVAAKVGYQGKYPRSLARAVKGYRERVFGCE